jgi:hypothetical protein
MKTPRLTGNWVFTLALTAAFFTVLVFMPAPVHYVIINKVPFFFVMVFFTLVFLVATIRLWALEKAYIKALRDAKDAVRRGGMRRIEELEGVNTNLHSELERMKRTIVEAEAAKYDLKDRPHGSVTCPWCHYDVWYWGSIPTECPKCREIMDEEG